MPASLTAARSNPLGFLPVWRRNFLVWKKLALPSILGNLADPMIYMLGLGYGLGAMLPSIDGQPYIAFLAAGTVCASNSSRTSGVMSSACAQPSTRSRMPESSGAGPSAAAAAAAVSM